MALWTALLATLLLACAAHPDGTSSPLPGAEIPETLQSPTQCLDGRFSRAKQLTHYVIPVLPAYNHSICNQLEGTCIYTKNGVEYLHNYGKTAQPLSKARCKNGYGNRNNCLHPCRTIAASMKFHRYGQIIYIKALEGQKCGDVERDGFEMIHDGYVIVQDTGSPTHFNTTGRFDFFWGRCKNYRNGVCFEGAQRISQVGSYSDYCVVWDPTQSAKNIAIKERFEKTIRQEAFRRGDINAANEFEVSHWSQVSALIPGPTAKKRNWVEALLDRKSEIQNLRTF